MQAANPSNSPTDLKKGVEIATPATPLHPTDIPRWSDPAKLHEEWDVRTVQMAQWVPPHSRVLEFGAARMVLRDHLPEGCVYIPSDVVDRGAGTMVCDLNSADWPKFPEVDVIFFAGVLEYLTDVRSVLARLEPLCRTMVISYAVHWYDSAESVKIRTDLGWINHLTWPQLELMFRETGFKVGRIARWNESILARFDKHSDQV